ncbi:MAG: hypothetical protein QOI59_2843 [Gammaproteobacteria bacterium]|jgi:hypothetical protein|nr:hypothetical protein [Gammaproteobacteria bacterium]
MDERLARLSDAELARLADLLAEAIHLGLLVREVDSTPYIELAAMCTAERAVRQFRARRHCGTVDSSVRKVPKVHGRPFERDFEH